MRLNEFYDRAKKVENYIFIAIISTIAIFFLPMIGSDPDVGWNFPSTVLGWVLYVFTKLTVSALNVLIFHNFQQQAKINVKDNPYYLEACEILRYLNLDGERDPRAPWVWKKETYESKGITVAITTLLSTVTITQAVLTFDLIAMLTYITTVIFGIIFGYISMRTAEDYWTMEFWKFAKKIQKELKNDNDRWSEIQEPPGAGS